MCAWVAATCSCVQEGAPGQVAGSEAFLTGDSYGASGQQAASYEATSEEYGDEAQPLLLSDEEVDRFLELARTGDLASVEAALAHLDAADETLFSNFALMHTSRSLQDAAPDRPRVIAFGLTGKLLLSFNSDRSQAGGDRLELITFRDRGEFEFFEVVFDVPTSTGTDVSDPNPPRCMACHGTNLRPNWEFYPTWRGAYGGNDDFMARQPERDQFLAFKASHKQHPRYQFLDMPAEGVAPYRPKRFETDRDFRPNLQLSRLLTRQQAHNVYNRLRANSDCYADYRHLLAYVLLRCESSGERSRPEYEELLDDASERLVAVYPRINKELRYMHSGYSGVRGSVRYLFQTLGLDAFDYSLQFIRPYAWSQWQQDGSAPLQQSLLSFLLREFVSAGELPEHSLRYDRRYDDYPASAKHAAADRYYTYPIARNPAATAACDDLQKHIDARLDSRGDAFGDACLPEPEFKAGPPAVVRMCQSCHLDPILAPNLDFDQGLGHHDPALGEEILWRVTADLEQHGHMPPERRLTNEERRQLIHWLELPVDAPAPQ